MGENFYRVTIVTPFAFHDHVITKSYSLQLIVANQCIEYITQNNVIVKKSWFTDPFNYVKCLKTHCCACSCVSNVTYTNPSGPVREK